MFAMFPALVYFFEKSFRVPKIVPKTYMPLVEEGGAVSYANFVSYTFCRLNIADNIFAHHLLATSI